MHAPTDLCVATCYLATDARVVAFLNALARALRSRGVELLVLATAEAEGLDAPQLQIPYDLAGFDAELSPPGALLPFHDVGQAREGDAAWTGVLHPLDTIGRGVAKCEWFYRHLARALAPCAALVWNTTLPHGRIARNTLHAQGVAAYSFERGLLPASYQIQTYEINAWNDLACSFPLHVGLAEDLARHSDEIFLAARRHYLAHHSARYPTVGRLDRAMLDAAYGTAGKRIVALFGSAAGSSLLPPSVPSIAFGRPPGEDLGGMLDAIGRALGDREDVVVLFQDHPINRACAASPELPPCFIRCEGLPVRDLLSIADRVAVLGTSTVQYDALLMEKPLLLFGRGLPAQAGAAYAATDTALSRAVAAWLDDRDGPGKRRNARALIGLLCERHLIAENVEAAHIRHGVDDLAAFLTRFSSGRRPPVTQRLEAFLEGALAACRQEIPA